MGTTGLARVFQAQGPFVSLYLDTSRGAEDAAQRVALRWKNARGELQAEGASEGTLAAIDPLVEGSHNAGAALGVVAGADGVLHADALPSPLPREVVVRHGPLPHLLPLLARCQALVPHVAVLTDRRRPGRRGGAGRQGRRAGARSAGTRPGRDPARGRGAGPRPLGLVRPGAGRGRGGLAALLRYAAA